VIQSTAASHRDILEKFEADPETKVVVHDW